MKCPYCEDDFSKIDYTKDIIEYGSIYLEGTDDLCEGFNDSEHSGIRYYTRCCDKDLTYGECVELLNKFNHPEPRKSIKLDIKEIKKIGGK